MQAVTSELHTAILTAIHSTQMVHAVSSVLTITTWMQREPVNRSVTGVKLGMKKLELVPAVSKVMEIQLKEFVEVPLQLITVTLAGKMIIALITVTWMLKRLGDQFGRQDAQRFVSNVMMDTS
jgi:hypothetical protein